MPKFENSNFVKLWDSREGRVILNSVLSNPDLVRANHTFWAQKFRVDPEVCPTDSQGRSTFIAAMREETQGALMDMRAPMSHNTPADAGKSVYYTGTIPSFSAKEYVETAAERMYKESIYDQFGDARLLAQFATDTLQRFVDSGNQTLSHMAAQVLSTGRIVVDWGEGIKGNTLDANVPTANRLNAGSSAWTDTSFDLIGHLRNLVDTLNSRHGEHAWQLEITRSKFENTFLKNTGVINWIKLQYAIASNIADPTNVPAGVVSTDNAVIALSKMGGLPVISIIDEKQNDVNMGSVSGWSTAYAVLRPVGYAGYVRHSNMIEREVYSKYGANTVSKVMAAALGGLGLVINTTLDNGELKEWHSEFIVNAIPTLDEFLMHYIIDTATAD